MELKKIKELIAELLKKDEDLRGNDDLLYLAVIKTVHPSWNNGTITTNIQNMTIGEFFSCRKKLNLPNFETVRRTRQKAQEENESLRPCEEVQKARKEAEENFYNFAKNQGELF